MLQHEVPSATMHKLLAFFNANTGGNKVTKFRDRVTAEKRVTLLITEMAAETEAEEQRLSKKEAAALVNKRLKEGEKVEIVPADLPEVEKRFLKSSPSVETPDAAQVALHARNGKSMQEKLLEHAVKEEKPIAPNHINRDNITKPWRRAKILVCDMHAAGHTKKEIIAAGVADGIKANTVDGAYYEMVVKGRCTPKDQA